ncbi:MAG TPA: hypothetical protein VNI54_04865 [Thermoanaerobaculia bacterium]|nr:hypothetical protein [Thermoanaerobaculia bacterium]
MSIDELLFCGFFGAGEVVVVGAADVVAGAADAVVGAADAVVGAAGSVVVVV